MATLGHIAVGLVAGRVRSGREPTRAMLGAMALYAGLAMLPDTDVAGFLLGIGQDGPLGHRGAVHSMAFAAVAGLLAGAVQAVRRRPWVATAATVGIVVASHGILDALTDGGMGVALLWPFSDQRFFFPWRPIPVAPIGLRFVTAKGLSVLAAEAALFAPMLAFALWPRSSPRSVTRKPTLGLRLPPRSAE